MVDIAIIIVNYNLTNDIRCLISSIKQKVSFKNYKILVVDNNSPNRDIGLLTTEFKDVEFVFLDKNYGFGYANNIGIKKQKAKYYLLLNPDTYLKNDLVSNLFSFMENNLSFGIVGPKIMYEDGIEQISALRYSNIMYLLADLSGNLGRYQQFEKKRRELLINEDFYEVDYVLGACLMIRKEIFDKIGFFDEDYFLFAEETDLCYRVNKYSNYKVIYTKTLSITHVGGRSTNQIKTKRIKWLYESKLIFYKKHYSKLKSFFLRSIIILIMLKYIIVISLKKNEVQQKAYIDTYWYLIKYYIIGKPILNKKVQEKLINKDTQHL